MTASAEAIASIGELRGRFGYPVQIGQALERTCAALMPLRPRAILLVGSAARGELTYRELPDGRLEMFSDLELFCLAEASPSAEAALHRETSRIERELFVPNGLFHIDCVVTPEIVIDAKGRGLLWFEGGRTCQVLYGPQEPYFGDLHESLLSLPLVNELLIIRLWWLLVHLPSWLLEHREDGGPDDPAEREALAYTQIRNMLDVLSIWLPNEGIFACGYRERVDHLGRTGELRGREYMPPGILGDLEEATRRKLACDLDVDPREWYARVVGAYEGLTGFLLDVPRGAQPRELLAAVRDGWSGRYAPPRSWRFRVYAAALTLRSSLRRGAGPRWLLRRGAPDAAALEFLIAMHRAARAQLAGDLEPAGAHLAAAAAALWRFAGISVKLEAAVDDARLARSWHDLRRRFVGPFTQRYRKVRGSRSAVERRISMDEERLSA